ncbi:SDR family oxidoreductase [Pedobacter metabolipauper]|uniref:Short-subunit dehydrogenase n=1 Tax=Pedobacter metabolipauper TaxID=425513 RepID=A0A4R6SQK6_9SPHI|nr:SDR family oxidoreductase [Pedobacter metabolipauper]TDQ06326.1 short-subunit dehydrogenase [Pedobacter metabolipauper]
MLYHKTIVITGASSGVGKAIALEFAPHQVNLVLASRNETALQEVADECTALGSVVKIVLTDVTDPGAMILLADEASAYTGQIDVWINNAGLLAAGTFDETPMAVHDQVIKTNLMGYLHGAHAVLPYFKKQGYGTLINNISIGGFLPVPFGVGYSASKFGLRGFSAALKAELTEWPDIHICDVFPAFLDTPGIQHAANYTGKQLKPAPPVYDPARVAIAVIKLAQNPKPEVMVGSLSTVLRLAYGVFPKLTRTITAKVISHYLKQAQPMLKSDGNVFVPVSYGNAVYGGWGVPGKPKAHRKYIAAGIVLISAVSLLLLRKR